MLTLLESSSTGFSVHHEDETPPPDASRAVPQLSHATPVVYPPLTRAEQNINAVESSHAITKIKKWVQMRTKKGTGDPTLHEPDRVTTKARRPAHPRPPLQSPVRVNEGPSRMAAGQRVPVSTLPR